MHWATKSAPLDKDDTFNNLPNHSILISPPFLTFFATMPSKWGASLLSSPPRISLRTYSCSLYAYTTYLNSCKQAMRCQTITSRGVGSAQPFRHSTTISDNKHTFGLGVCGKYIPPWESRKSTKPTLQLSNSCSKISTEASTRGEGIRSTPKNAPSCTSAVRIELQTTHSWVARSHEPVQKSATEFTSVAT